MSVRETIAKSCKCLAIAVGTPMKHDGISDYHGSSDCDRS